MEWKALLPAVGRISEESASRMDNSVGCTWGCPA